MSEFIFFLLLIICIGLIYVVHRFFGKHEFYLLACIYSVLAFLLSFKLVNVFNLNINLGIIFTSGLMMLLYYFVGKYDASEIKKLIMTIMISTLSSILLVAVSSLMIPSLYDNMLSLFRDLLSKNLVIAITYPLSLIVTLTFSGHSFLALKKVEDSKLVRTIVTFLCIIFIDVFTFIYISYAILIKYDKALLITVDNFFIKAVIVALYFVCINKIFKMRKVKL